jgi:hypothetical protein
VSKLDDLCDELRGHMYAAKHLRAKALSVESNADGTPRDRTQETLDWLDECDKGDTVVEAIENERQALSDEVEAHEMNALWPDPITLDDLPFVEWAAGLTATTPLPHDLNAVARRLAELHVVDLDLEARVAELPELVVPAARKWLDG